MALKIVGTGPGSADEMTARARRAIEDADIIVGYTLYNELLRKEFPDKEYYDTPMRREAERCRYALERAAEGLETVLICSGDSGVYGMASLVFELAEQIALDGDDGGDSSEVASVRMPEIEVIPGITAALSGGARLGAPLSNDFAVVSLSDLLTPWSVIEKRLEGAASGDFVIALYNPGSKKRREHLGKACRIIMKYRGAETPCGIVSNIGRDGEGLDIMTLGELCEVEADMLMTVFIGNSVTRVIDGRLVTPRGYVENGRTGDHKISVMTDSADSDGMDRVDCVDHIAHIDEKAVFGAAEDVDLIKSSVEKNMRNDDLKYGAGDTVVIFGGTTEGRLLVEAAARSGARVLLSVATDYGEEVLEDMHDMENIEVYKGHLDTSKMISLIDDARPCVVFDATHPYATEVTASVSAAAAAAGVRYVRVRRDISVNKDGDPHLTTCVPDVAMQAAGPAISYGPAAYAPDSTTMAAGPYDSAAPDMTYVPDVSTAAAVLNRTAACAFITTGSRGAAEFGKVEDAENRLTIRVLPSEEAIKLCRDAGFKGKNIICMQGPFSSEINEAMFRAAGADILVTKLSGKTGGFPEKIEAARRLGMKIIVITPPEDMPGITLEAACAMFG